MWNHPSQGFSTLAHILHFRAVFFRAVIRYFLKFFIRYRDAEAVAEFFQAVFIQLFGVVRRVGTFHGRKGIAFDGFGQDNSRSVGGFHRLLVGCINLEGIMSATVQFHDVIIGQMLHHLQQLGTFAEKVLTGIGSAPTGISLVFTIHDFIHAPLQQAFGILGQQSIPVASPDNLDDIPACTTEYAFQFLNYFTVTPDRPIETLQITIDDKIQVTQAFTSGQADCSE